MKNLAVKTLLITTLSTVLFASQTQTADQIAKEQQEAQIKLMSQMITLEEGMASIQEGFLYNNLTLVEDGVLKVRSTIRSIAPTDTRDLLTMRENAVNKFSRKQINKIDTKIYKVLVDFKENDKTMAIQHYTKVLKECMNCHVRIRKW